MANTNAILAEIPPDLMEAVTAIEDFPVVSMAPKLAAHLMGNRVINDWEYDFSINTFGNHGLSDRQLLYRVKIHLKVLRHFGRLQDRHYDYLNRIYQIDSSSME